MNKLIGIAILALTTVVSGAQTVTNIAWRVQVETGTVGGSTNTVTTNFRYDYGNAKDLIKINGYVFAWNQYQASGGTNNLNTWLKTDVGDRAKSYGDVKSAADNAALLAKLQSLLLTNPDLLSASDFTELNTIAAKAP